MPPSPNAVGKMPPFSRRSERFIAVFLPPVDGSVLLDATLWHAWELPSPQQKSGFDLLD